MYVANEASMPKDCWLAVDRFGNVAATANTVGQLVSQLRTNEFYITCRGKPSLSLRSAVFSLRFPLELFPLMLSYCVLVPRQCVCACHAASLLFHHLHRWALRRLPDSLVVTDGIPSIMRGADLVLAHMQNGVGRTLTACECLGVGGARHIAKILEL